MKPTQFALIVSSIILIGGAVPLAKAQSCGDSGEQFISSEEGTGAKYRKIGFNGFPLPDEKPQATPETDAEEEESFVDAFNHSLTYQVTDVYVPFQGTDLTLSIRRNWRPEIWNFGSGAKPGQRPDRPFGGGWTSNLSAGLRIEGGEVPYAYVTDTNGVTYRFLVLMGAIFSADNVCFIPMPENRHQREVMASKLEKVGDKKFKFTSKMGTVLEFEDKGTHLQIEGDNGVYIQWARLTKATDRFGTELEYTYTGTPDPYESLPKTQDISPTTISCRGKSITISYTTDGQVDQITDPRGKVLKYHFENLAVPGDPPFSQNVKGLTSVERFDSSTVEYDYVFNQAADSTPNPDPNPQDRFYFMDLSKIKDPNGDTTTISYRPDLSRQTYMVSDFFVGWFRPSGSPFNVAGIRLPDGTSSSFSNQSDVRLVLPSTGAPLVVSGQHTMVVTDAKGGTWTYNFSDGLAVTLDLWKDLIGFGKSPYTPKMVLWQSMVVSTPEGGTMEATFEKSAGMALKTFKDVGVTNSTQFEYSDVINTPDQNVQPWMKISVLQSAIDKLPTTYWGDVNKQTDGRGKIKEFSYDPKWRVMKRITDEEGRVTEYTIDSTNGNRLKEEVKPTATGTAIRTTNFVYSNVEGLTGVLTRKTIVGGTTVTEANPAGDLVTEYTLNGTTGNIVAEKVGGLTPTEYTYDANNNKLTAKDPRGNTTSFVYDDLNRLKKVLPPRGADNVEITKEFTYDLRGNKIAEKDENNHNTLWQYDALGRVIKEARDMNGNDVIDGDDIVTETTYNELGAKSSVKSPNGDTTTMEYDGLNRLVKTTDPLGKFTTYEYGTNSGGLQFGRDFQPTKVVNARGFQTKTTYDASFRPTDRKVQYALNGENPVFAETKFEYDDVGNLIKETDPLNHDTLHTYDALNRETDTTWPDLSTSHTFFTSAGLKWKTEDELYNVALQNETLTEYDKAGRPVKVSSPAVDYGEGLVRSVTQTSYDDAGNILSTTNPLGKIWTFAYDNRNRKITEVRPGTGSPTLHWTYDDVGNVIKTTDALGYETDTSYDVANRVVTIEQPEVPLAGGGTVRPTTVKGYDKNGNVTTLTDPNSHVTTNTYDPLNRLLTTTDAEGIVVTNTYDAVGNRRSVVDGKWQLTKFEYDGLNRVIAIHNPVEAPRPGYTTSSLEPPYTTFEYDAMNKIARVDTLGQRTEYGYDLRNRLLTVSYKDADGNPVNDANNATRVYIYDLTGNLLSVTELAKAGKADVAYTYDALKRQITETSGGLTHTYKYDLAGNRIYSLYGGLSVPLVSEYDEQNRLTTLTQGALVTTYGYDSNGNVLLKTLPNGDKDTAVFDAINRTTSLTGTTSSNAALYGYAYEYDAGGNVKKVTETYPTSGMNRVVANDYDDINRLTTETVTGNGAATTEFTYDDANNRETMTKGGVTTHYDYNINNQLTGFTEGSRSVSFGYDTNGNRITRSEGSATDTFSWDYENRLIGLTKQSTEGIGTYAWAYDYRTRRVNLTTPTEALTQVVFSGGTSVRELQAGAPTVDYVRGSDWGGGVGGILYTLRAGVPSYTHFDRRGDVTAKTDSTGTITYQAEYEAFGKRTSETGATADRQKSNTKDEDIPGYANEGFRSRDLETGDFISRDPIGHTLMQPADKWFLDGNAVTAQEYAEATLPGLVKETSSSPTKTAKNANDEAQFESYVRSEKTIPGETSHWHIAEPGQPNIYAFCQDNPWTKFDPEGLSDIYLNRDVPTGADKEQRRSPGNISIVEGGKQIYEGRANVNGFMKDPKTGELTRGVPKGEYTIQPKATDGRYPAGTPAITAPGQPPGKPGPGYQEDAVLIHPKNPDGSPDSLSCVTVDPKAAKLVKDVMERDRQKGETTKLHVLHKSPPPPEKKKN